MPGICPDRLALFDVDFHCAAPFYFGKTIEKTIRRSKLPRSFASKIFSGLLRGYHQG